MGLVHMAGQIPLLPATMALPSPPRDPSAFPDALRRQTARALRSAAAVSVAMRASLSHGCLALTVYVAEAAAGGGGWREVATTLQQALASPAMLAPQPEDAAAGGAGGICATACGTCATAETDGTDEEEGGTAMGAASGGAWAAPDGVRPPTNGHAPACRRRAFHMHQARLLLPAPRP